MPRGLPDYFNPDTIVSQRLANVEEVVTIIRGIASLDNRGRTLFYDHFATGLGGWKTTKTNNGVLGASSTTWALVAPNSAYLDAGTVGINGYSSLNKRIHLGSSKRLGLEASILFTANVPDFWLEILYNLDGDEYNARLRVEALSGDVDIELAGGWQNVGEVGYAAPANGPWLLVKMVADYSTGMFVRALIGQEQIDLSDYALPSTAVSAPGKADFKIRAKAIHAVTNDAYIGHGAITVDEP
jgi:hypothetical protein